MRSNSDSPLCPGAPACDPSDPDYVPSLKLGYCSHLPDPQLRSKRHQRYQQRAADAQDRSERCTAAHVLVDLSHGDAEASDTSDNDDVSDIIKQKDCEIAALKHEVSTLQNTVTNLTEELNFLKSAADRTSLSCMQSTNFTAEFIQEKDSD